MYHEWNEANQNSHILPTSIPETHTFLQYANLSSTTSNNFKDAEKTLNRFFRVPFEKPMGSQDYTQILTSSFWYAHFYGQYIVRQMTIPPNLNKAILLQTGNF